MMKPKLTENFRASAIAALVVGTGVTLIINVLHANPSFWPRMLSASVPVILFLTLHTAAYAKSLLVRCLMGPVALMAFTVSFDHMNSYAMRNGENYHMAKVYPTFIDGALVVATIVLALSVQKVAEVINTETDEEVPDEIVVTPEDLMSVLWESGSLMIVPEEERAKIVRSEMNKRLRDMKLPEIGASKAKNLVREYEKEHAS